MDVSSKVKVAVRVRPLNRREIELGTDICIDMDNNQTFLKAIKAERKPPRTFAYDYCFWSMDEEVEKFASQEFVYKCLGKGVVDNAFDGYNACIFAYGQTGSGKSYTMMGSPSAKGLIPRICDCLFENIAGKHEEDPNMSFKVEVSYMEIYNEKVRDLLCPKSDKQNLKVREHKLLGPYVDGLSKLVVSCFQDIENLMVEGNKSRTVAATMMNAESSRSHAVFNVVLTQRIYDPHTESTGEKVSKISLVDLAGSERVSKTGAAGDRLKEGGNINKSLSTLGLVISALADQASGKHRKGFVPYRDSVLTWLLKDNLGGNSKTVMVATISPAADNYEETLSTLRYADRAKRIENHAVINEDPNAKIIRELRQEVERLRELLQSKAIDLSQSTLSKSGRDSAETGNIREELAENEKLIQECTKTWEEKEKQTEMIHKERHQILEEMGISVQDSGIGVKEGRYFLVNLNADPSLNELLVYYLKEHTLIGRHNSPKLQDIQLSGLGILKEHCIVDIDDEIVYLEPFAEARTCVNGQQISERTQLRHGDRILLGNNYFFRLNCPHSTTQMQDAASDQTLDFDFAQTELMLNEFYSLDGPATADKNGKSFRLFSKEPIKDIIKHLEEHHEKEKQGALEEQRKQYEEEIERLRKNTPVDSLSDAPQSMDGRLSLTTSGYGSRLSDREGSNFNLLEEKNQDPFEGRDMSFEESLRVLREEVLRANSFVREANQLSSEMGKNVEYAVTLQIPTSSLSLGGNRTPLTSEVAIVVKHSKRGTQVWSVEKLKNKLYGMRDLYQQTVMESSASPDSDSFDDDGLFYEVECHTLIGVATIWLECLFESVPLDYAAPIISQQGEVCGKLMVDIRRLHDGSDSESQSSGDSESDVEQQFEVGRTIQVQVTIHEATGLPPTLCNYVFCQYNLYDQPLTVVPPINVAVSADGVPKSNAMQFKHSQIFNFEINDDFLEYISESSLAIEVYGNRSQGYESPERYNWKIPTDQDDTKTPAERWNELVRKIELWAEIHELNEQGTYSPVELQTRDATECGGVFQLRQGFSRRIVVQVAVPKQGQLPVVLERIKGIAIGSVKVRVKIQKGLDSYQERDLQRLRDKWSSSLLKRREYLDEKIQGLINKKDKSVADKEREGLLIDQWVSLTEERNNVLCPAPGSGVPGAPIDWNPCPGMEKHIPLIFLNLDENVLGGCPDLEPEPAGLKSLIQLEEPDRMIDLNILRYDQQKVIAYASWDSSMHDSLYLNRVTQNNERIYLIVKVTLRLCSPAVMDLVLRKRICVKIYKKQGFKESLMKRFIRPTNVLSRNGVTFQLVSHIPKQSGEETEERQDLARKAADAMTSEQEIFDGDAIEKYNKGVTRVTNILNLHKLRQRVLLEEKLATVGRSNQSLKKYASTPNLFNANRTQSLTNLFKASTTFGSNSELAEKDEGKSTEKERRNELEVPLASRSMNAGEAVVRRNRSGPRIPANRHSFYGFESTSLIQSREIVAESPPAKLRLPDTQFLNTNNLSSTPVSKVLHPLIEDDSPTSPFKSQKALFDKDLGKDEAVEISQNSVDLSSIIIEGPDDDFAENDINEQNSNERESVQLSENTEQDVNDKDKSRNSIEINSNKNERVVAEIAEEGQLLSREEEESLVEDEMTQGLKIGDKINLGGDNTGQVRFVGKTEFADGMWAGVELTSPNGKNDGSVNGVSYFKCDDKHGLFIRLEKLMSLVHSR
ncbi:kinesin-like protein KIF13B isoform X4 [Rhopilema esculentum]|uniref:kinesin-like protein KIF13B isoform X3 n=1 Tax=Rhopilema esculentum TaxID=499914 RepID=UPI0031D1B7F5